MTMTLTEQIITIAICALGTLATRVLPAAVFGMLVVYCLKNVSFLTGTHGLPELIAIAATVALHLSWGNMLVSIAGGTVVYMLLVQLVF